MSVPGIPEKMEFEADGCILEIINVFVGSRNREDILLEILENEICITD